MKKLISFSIWGSNPKYTLPALTNIELAAKYYPGWICRFYHDMRVPQDILDEMDKMGAERRPLPNPDGNYGMFWRFYPADDASVDQFIVRDTDSRLNPREADAVLEWEESGKMFHTMRDNIHHDPVPICGGMWGAKKGFVDNFQLKLVDWIKANSHRAFGHPRGKWFFMDQVFLAERIWPLVVNNSIAHVSYDSKWAGLKKPFRVKNPDGSFVGQPYES